MPSWELQIMMLQQRGSMSVSALTFISMHSGNDTSTVLYTARPTCKHTACLDYVYRKLQLHSDDDFDVHMMRTQLSLCNATMLRRTCNSDK